MKKRIVFLVLVVLCVSLFSEESVLIKHIQQAVKAADIFTYVETLASPEYEGRLTGTEGYNKAVRLAADHFRKYGLQPLIGHEDYTQSFPLSYTKVYESQLTIYLKDREGKEEVIRCEYFKNFYPLGFSGSGDARGEIVFAGYGITAPEYGYDDYEGIDVRGKIVMIIKGVPKAKAGEDWRSYDTHRFRTTNAKNHGVSALLYIYSACGNPNGEYRENFPMVAIGEKLADRLFKKYGKDTKALRKQLNKREKVSFVTDIEAEVMVKSENLQGTAFNVVGYIPGTDERLKHEFIVIGAHFDHCGMWPALTPGADDNASGSAAVMAAAKALGTCEYKPKRSLLFILFAGEEMGLLGSTYFASHLPAKIKKIKFVFNMDMVGAGPDVFILRLQNYPEVETVIKEAREKLKLSCKIKGNKVTRQGRDGADHAPFVKKGIPAVSVFSSGGKHHGYHTDEDTIYWITPKITEDIAKIVAYSSMKLAMN